MWSGAIRWPLLVVSLCLGCVEVELPEPRPFTLVLDFRGTDISEEDFLFIVHAVSRDFPPPPVVGGQRTLGRAYVEHRVAYLYLDAFTVWERVPVTRRELLTSYANTTSHEIGHLLGLPDGSDPQDLMVEPADFESHIIDNSFRR